MVLIVAFTAASFILTFCLKDVQNGFLLSALFLLVAGALVSVVVSGIVIRPFLAIENRTAQIMLDISRREELLNTVNRMANILLQTESDNFEDSLYQCMSMIGNSISADRVCIWKNKTVDEKLYCDLVYDWPGGAGSLMNSSVAINVSYSDNTPGWEEILSGGNCINTSVSQLSREEKAQLEAHGVKSLFVAPVFMRGEFWGYVGFDDYTEEKVFAPDEAATLHSGSLLIANALVRNSMMLSISDTSNQLEEALSDAMQANEAKSSFLANMSHEMRTPLNAIIGLTDLTLGNDRLDEESYLNLEKINSAGMVLLSTVNDILDISKIEAGKFELISAVYDIPSLINDTVTQSIAHKEEKPIRFTLNIDGNLPSRLIGDELRIKQILNNLLSNAFKYTKKGAVEFGLYCENALSDHGKDSAGIDDAGGADVPGPTLTMVAYVRDTGIGIAPEYIGNIFDDYSQMDSHANRNIMGTGLGLSITRRMVTLMNGSIKVESELNKGSVFTVSIPQGRVNDDIIGQDMADNLKNFHYYEQKRRQISGLSRISLPYAKVLVVDDVVTNLDVAKGLMRPYGMQIDCVTSGQEAIEAIRNETVHYNAVFMDHMMPGMDGIEATRHIREIGTRYAKTIPVIALTANAITGSEEMFLDKGFQAFISKPVDLSRLDAVIRRWVRNKEQEKLFFGRQVSVDGDAITDTRSGSERRADNNRRSGVDRRSLGRLYNKLDFTSGIERFAGSEAIYLGILRSYAINTKPLLEKIRDVSGDTLEDYAITVHGIKGSSRGIFAKTASDMAEALEMAAKDRDSDYIRDNNQQFISVVGELISDIEGMLERIDNESPKPTSDEPDRETLSRLLTACKKYDMDGIDDALAELEKFNYSTGNDLVACLREYADEADFTSISDKLSYIDN